MGTDGVLRALFHLLIFPKCRTWGQARSACAWWPDSKLFTAADLVVPLFPFLDKICGTLCSRPTTLMLTVPCQKTSDDVFCAFHNGWCFKGKAKNFCLIFVQSLKSCCEVCGAFDILRRSFIYSEKCLKLKANVKFNLLYCVL